MNLRNKKELTARTLNVGKGRISMVKSRLEEVKEAITKQDIRDLVSNGAIIIKERKGRKKVKKRKNKRRTGKVKKKVNKRKQEYVKITRKLRGYSKEMGKQGRVSKEEHNEIRKKIRDRIFKSKAHLKNYMEGIKK